MGKYPCVTDWSPEKIQTLDRLLAAGLCVKEVALTMDITRNAVYGFIHRRRKVKAQPPLHVEVGYRVKVISEDNTYSFGIVAEPSSRPRLAYQNLSHLPLQAFDRILDCTQIEWLTNPTIHYR